MCSTYTQRYFLLVLGLPLLLLIGSCAKQVEPTSQNINKIFASKDFTFAFVPLHGEKKSLSFRVDYLVYQSDGPTIRREISYNEVLLINNFIQELVRVHNASLSTENHSYYMI
ncbi:hypothetical protein [Aquimarina brevivitae]|uniref:Uncharacterized protein n=1 Tax=Aquimarina brevivitae TaxID=323412 RepID=A0A4Q7PFC9_9FLAO|nr:hypothetical protein [Aquimarina brevivitae]RZS99164.1 hypothetical protein EV197_0373 [Aquimarina brevivitae]